MRNITSYLNNKLKNSQQTPSNKSNPRMSIQVSRARTTIMDSDYWTVETIRENPNLGDISVAPRRLKAFGSPNRIYEIHVDDGKVSTAIREYPDKFKDGWKEQFNLGFGSSVAITFDGDWESFRGQWRLVTEEKPWIFWVDENNVLWRQHWDDEATKAELAVNVVYVRAIRAWKNRFFPLQDQGIVVSYIKSDGTVWYRNYCYQVDGTYSWEYERKITDFTAKAISLNLFITNDYRMGFVIEDLNRMIHWMITDRNWAGMAIEQHTISIRPYVKVNLNPVNYHHMHSNEVLNVIAYTEVDLLFGRRDNSIIHVLNQPLVRLNELGEEYEDWGFIVRFELNFESKTLPTVNLYDTFTGSSIPILSVLAVKEGYIYDAYVDNSQLEFGFNTIRGSLEIAISGMHNEAGYNYHEINEEFVPTALVLPDLPLPEVEVIWNE